MSREHPSEPRLCPDGRYRKQFNFSLDVELMAALKALALNSRPKANPAAHVECALEQYLAKHKVTEDAPWVGGNGKEVQS